MQAQHHISSDAKATTTPRRLMAIRIVGTALFDYQIQKTPDARIRLETAATMAHHLGDLTADDAAIVAQMLARPLPDRASKALPAIQGNHQ